MANEERQENLEEIKKAIEKDLKKSKKYSAEELDKIMKEANENVEFLKVLEEINLDSTSKRVIFVDGKACLVYDSGVFYIEDSIDSKKAKKKLTRQQATELYVEYFFRYIMNPAIERKKMLDQIHKIAVKDKPAKSKTKARVKEEKVKKEETLQFTEKVEKSKQISKEEYIR